MGDQRGVRDGLRARAGTLLTAASLVTSFLGGVALSRYRAAHPHAALTNLAWSAIAAFIAVVVMAVVILMPWRWRFNVDPKVLVEDHLREDARTEPDRLRRFLALRLDAYHGRNAKILRRLFVVFVLACGFLIYEAVAWLLILGRR
jgi:hypothetical protein